MAFEKGNQLGKKSRQFEQTVRRAIAQDDGQRLRDCVEKLLDLAVSGEAWAVSMLRDTLDGKPAQTLDIGATVTFAEAISGLGTFMAEAIAREETGDNKGVGEERPLLPVEVPTQTH